MDLAIGPMGWGLIVGIPLAAIALSEIIERLRRRKVPLADALRGFRNVTLPLLSAVLILQYVFQLTANSQPLRVLQTALWLSFLINGLHLLSTLFTPSSRRIKGKIQVPSLYLMAGRILVVVLCAIYILANIWQIDLARITSALGVGSLVVALALQDTLSNLVSGFLLLLDRPFNEGDWLQLGDVEAEVLEVNWRSVRLRNRDRDIIIIPNGELGKATICNYTLLDLAHAETITVGFSYDDPPNVVKPVLLKAVAATEGAMASPAPVVRVVNYGDFSVDYNVKFFLTDYQGKDDIASELRSHIYYMARRQGLTIPYPIALEYQLEGAALAPPETVEPILNILKGLTYFSSISPDQLSQLAQESELETYGRGEQIVAAGDLAPGFFIIQYGSVSLSAMSDQGESQEVTRLQAGDCFGERVLLRTEPSLVTVSVVEDLKAVRISPWMMANIAERNAKFARDINQLIDERVREVRIATQTSKDKTQGYLNKLLAS
ncbi:transporter, MscS family [Synechococcus sp. PCC 7335]|uniref:mechanosensitive ion channel family protein n=1 Tax=Synechococcus sp. (strain ATCC 29403 / PCC 7335) TaxID=91464 RepID=UPI00017ECB68|nr:mechanosensitive ion channel family protein [Synechococcus sp. PCC 7335]EDX83233.1 transporter, MscS family [Synechococcus sp. PCC 7335]